MEPKLKAIKSLKGAEGIEVLEALLKKHPQLAPEAEQLAQNVLGAVAFEEVADDVADALKDIDDIDNLNSRAGSTRYGYVEPSEAACEICEEAIEPFLEDLKRRLKIEDRSGAGVVCQGIVLGLYQVKHASGGVIEWAGDWLCDEAGHAIDLMLGKDHKPSKQDRILFPESFLEMVPKWAAWIRKEVGQ
jgi:hypothetical protein